MKQIINCCAGLDVHKMVIVATIITETEDDPRVETRSFKTFQKDRKALAQWLKEAGVQLVIMESTGVYWRSIYQTLEKAKIDSWVVNARHIKKVPGRKTDVSDSHWLAQLGAYGLVRPSFVPEFIFRELRLLTRRRLKVTGMLASEKLRLHKQLDNAGIRLGGVVTDINGVSAKLMITGLIEGRAPTELAEMAKGRLRAKLRELALSLDEPISKADRFVLKQLQNHLADLEAQIAELDREITLIIQKHCEKQSQLLQTIPGIDQVSAALILAEIGIDMDQFGSLRKISSWAGVCPGNNESAGKRKSGKTTKGNQWLRQVLCEVAHAASKTKSSQFQSYYQSLVIRRGKKRSIIAVAHKVLRVIYSVLHSGEPYQDPGIDYDKLVVDRNASRWLKKLQEYGYLARSAVTTS